MNKKSIILLICGVVTLILSIVGVSYAFFAGNQTTSSNITFSVDVAKDFLDANFIVTPGNTVNLKINNDNTLIDKTGNAMATSSTNMQLKLTSTQNITCSYDLSWEWLNSTSKNQYVKTSGATNEFTIEGTNGTNSFTKQLNNYGSSTTLGTYQISANNGQTIQNWDFNLTFYNLNLVQDKHAGANYSGKVVISNVNCEKVGPLITDKNGTEYTKDDLALGQVIEYVNGKYVTVVDLNTDGHYKLADGSDANAVVALTDSNGKLISLTDTTVDYQSANTSNYYGSSDLKTTIDSYYTLHASELSFLKEWQVAAANETSSAGTANGVTMLDVYLAAPSSSEIFGSNHNQGNTDESTRQFGYYDIIGENSSYPEGYGFWLRSPSNCKLRIWNAAVSVDGEPDYGSVIYDNYFAAVGVGCL